MWTRPRAKRGHRGPVADVLAAADQGAGRHADVGEADVGRPRALLAHLGVLDADLDARRASAGTRKTAMPGPLSSAGRLRAKTTNRSAMGALVMKRLSPLMIQSISDRRERLSCAGPTGSIRRRARSARRRPRPRRWPCRSSQLGLLLVGAESDEHLAGDAVVGAEHRPQRQRGVAQLHRQLDILGQVQARGRPTPAGSRSRTGPSSRPARAGRRAPGRRRGSPARAARPRCERSDGSGPGSPGNPRR